VDDVDGARRDILFERFEGPSACFGDLGIDEDQRQDADNAEQE
jgi:hypothetical protein